MIEDLETTKNDSVSEVIGDLETTKSGSVTEMIGDLKTTKKGFRFRGDRRPYND